MAGYWKGKGEVERPKCSLSFFTVPREKGKNPESWSGIGRRAAQGCLLIGPVLWGPL